MAVDREKVLQAAQKFVERNRYDKAIVEYQRLVAEDPKDVRTLLKIGDLFLRDAKYAEAIETYESVAHVYTEQNALLKAIRVYRQILEIIDKKAPNLLERFGYVLPRLAEHYTALGLTSDASATYDDLATRLQKAGKEREAIEALKKVVDLDPTNPIPHLKFAESLIKAKDTPGAIEQLGTAAELLVKMGRRDDGIKVIERLLQLKPEAKYAKLAGQLYLDRGQANDAMAALAKLQISYKENSKDLETLNLIARSFDKIGQPARAIEVQKQAARTAKESGKLEMFEELVDLLLKRAPSDADVQQLAAQRAPAPAPHRSVAPSVTDAELEIIEEADIEIEEAVPSAAPVPAKPARVEDDATRTRHIIRQVEAYRGARDYPNAIALLREGIGQMPASRQLRERLCDVLMESGDQEGAIRQMLVYAQRLSAENDTDAAVRVLDEILLIESNQPDAMQMLRALGYVQSAEEEEQAAPVYEPVPSQQHAQQPVIDPTRIDDPFADVQPRYQLDEAALDEVDFYTSQGMFTEAQALLDDQLAKLPTHRLLLEKKAELEEMIARASVLPMAPVDQSGTRVVPRSEYPGVEDRSEEIAAMIDALDQGIDFHASAGGGDDKWSADTIFAQFKQGVAQQVDESDAATRYDLGVAYREMGMFMEAIGEFELAARDPNREAICCSMIGMIHLQLGNADAAIDAFLRGLEARQKTKEQELALAYELADAYESRKNPEQAIYYFERVQKLDPSYRDPRGAVQERIQKLRPQPAPAHKSAKAAGAELLGEDFDLAFDDLFSTSGKKL
ncbi:tetratricopeptide repeat protein [Polyangium aurulentum]|uniref:tetratricopeptide repeat protein n=1 Tax=Polyangium aurulentum TaxID=2567896 RepID=UPI0010AE0B7D|nr:tetratricopeptide repeat protein [Polyangium aurulentum]UQA61694.1 tetratricopeptide repeat protein [Polyangium aurulentum]